MKIVQISTVVEQYPDGEGGFKPYEDATVYGLGDDGKVYYYGDVGKEGVTEYGWKPYGE